MTQLVWDSVGERFYETGVNKGVLYIPDEAGVYDTGVAWNGLTTVTESPSGAEATPTYADNIKYLNLISAEEFGATIEAYTYPEEFLQFDGVGTASAGVYVGQQTRKVFGFSYQTRIGNDLEGTDHGYKIHMVYGAQAAPSEKAFATINDSPEAITLSWEVSTTPVSVTGFKPTATMTIDSTKVDAGALSDLEDILYGTVGDDPRLPLPDEVIAIFEGTVTDVSMSDYDNQPTFDDTTNVVTIPSVTGVQFKINGTNTTAGAKPALTVGQTSNVTAHAQAGYNLVGPDEWSFSYEAP